MKKREIWALYLPQFYETQENNEWWGEGFTEWTNVRKAKPLFRGHVQPIEPYQDDYYCLDNVDVMERQGKLARKYGISNFVVYHYWYEGRLLLEKPMELLLGDQSIDFPFCFCWANHSWTRAWDGKNHEILVEQTYGGEGEWEEHLQYLMPFFKDKRYRKIDNMPVLFIYKAGSIENGSQRIQYWNERLKQEGFNGIYIIEYISTFNPRPSLDCSQGVFEDEPNFSDRFKISPLKKAQRIAHKITKTIDKQSSEYLWKRILSNNDTYGDRAVYKGAFGLWDNSPRKGKESRVFYDVDPIKFSSHINELLYKVRNNESGIIVFNAWNEWGEGAVLEPTKQFGFTFLEAIHDALMTEQDIDMGN